MSLNLFNHKYSNKLYSVLLYIFLSAALVLSFAFLPLSAFGQETNPVKDILPAPGGQIKRIKIPNGPTVILQYVPGMSACAVALAVPCGSNDDTSSLSGRAHLLEHAMFRSTKKFPKGKLLLDLEAVGAKRGANTTASTTVFWELVPNSSLDLALAVEMDRLSGFAFTQQELNREKHILINELRELAGNKERRVETYLLDSYHNPSSLSPDGDAAKIKNISLEDLKDLYQQKYQADKSVLTITGGVEPEFMEAKLQRLLNGAPYSLPTAHPKIAIADHISAQPSDLPYLNMYLFKTSFENLAEVYLMDALLVQGKASLLSESLSKEGLDSRIVLCKDDNLLDGFYKIVLKPDKKCPMAHLDTLVKDSLAKIKDTPVDSETLDKVKSRAKANFYAAWNNLTYRCVSLAQSQIDGNLELLLQVPDNIDKATSQTLQMASLGLFAQDNIKSYVPSEEFEQNVQNSDILEAALQSQSALVVHAPNIERKRLDNGTSLLVWTDDSLPCVTLKGYILGGALMDPKDKPGLTYLSAMALNPQDKQNCGDLIWQLEEKGVKLSFKGDTQVVTIEGWCLKKDLPLLLNTLSETLQSGRVTAELLENEKQILLKRQKNRQNTIGTMLGKFMTLIYPANHPFATSYLGNSQSLNNINPDIIEKHIKSFVRPDRIVLSFTGDVTEETVINGLPDSYKWWNGSKDTLLPIIPEIDKPKAVKVNTGYDGLSAVVIAGGLGPKRLDPDYPAFSLLLQILGGNPDTSRLAIRLIHLEKICTFADTRILPYSENVPWAAIMKIKPDKSDRAISVLKQEMIRLANPGPTDNEIKRAISLLNGKLDVSLTDPHARAELMCSLELHHLSDQWIEGYAGLYEKITPNELRKTAKKWLNPNGLVIVESRP